MNFDRAASSISTKPIAHLAAAALLALSPAYGQNGVVGIASPAGEITVDGDLGDWPGGGRRYPIGRIEFGDEPGGEDDLEADFRIAYDPTGRALYLAVEVRDDSVVLDGPGEVSWDAQDGCELFLDVAHAVSGSPVTQYARYGDQDRAYGLSGASEEAMEVAVARTGSGIVYEWRVEVGVELDPDRVIGFDVSVADKDEDGSFSWAAWGSGTQKLDMPDRCGEILLVGPETRLGAFSGNIAWEDSSPAALPARVRLQSSRSEPLWRVAIVDPTGAYTASDLPEGPYSVHAVDSADLRVDATPHVDVRVEADRPARADTLRVRRIPWPGLIGDEGVLRGPGPVDPEELDRVVQAYLGYFKTPGISIAVIKDFEVVYRRGLGVKDMATHEAVGDDTVFEAASMTKPVFAYLVLRLVDRGVLELDTPLYTYLPYDDIAHDERHKLITARMVLTHRAGFPNWRTGALDIKFTPGTEVSYSGEGFVYLGKVVEHLTGKDLVDLCREEVFTPLGIENSSLVWDEDVARLTATGHNGNAPLAKGKPEEPNVAASLHIDAGNYAKFLIAVLRGVGLSESASEEMLRPQVEVPDQAGRSWGLGIAIEETPHGVHFGHGGRNTGFTSNSRMDQDRGIGYVFLVNNDDASKIDNVLNAYLIAGESGLEETSPVARRAVEVDPSVYDAYVGRYRIDPAVIVTITREGDRLMAQATGEGKVEIFPESEAVFFFSPTSDATVTFVKDDESKVTHLVSREEGRDTEVKRLEDGPRAEEAR